MKGALSAAAITLAVFAPVLRNGFVNWDDPLIFSGNPKPGELSWTQLRWMLGSLGRGDTYSPLCLLFNAILYRLGGGGPAPYHAASLLLHALAAAAAFATLRRLWDLAGERSGAAAACLFGALLFALHPLQVESVAAATSLGDLASCLLTLCCVLAYLHGRPGLALTAALGSGLWKWQGVCMPVYLVLADLAAFRRRPRWRALAPFMMVSLFVLGLYAAAKAEHAQYQGVGSRPLEAAAGLLFYPLKWLAPSNLMPVYYIQGGSGPQGWPAWLNAAAATTLTAAAWLGRRRLRWAAAAWVFYLAAVAPTLLFSQSGPLYAHDRYAYLPGLAFSGLAASLVGRRKAWSAFLILPLLAFLTRRQIAVWRDSEALWRHALAVEPRSDLAHYRLGSALVEQGRYDEAFAVFREELEINRPAAAINLAHAHHNLGADLYARGRVKEAEAELEEALRWDPSMEETRRGLETVRARRRN